MIKIGKINIRRSNIYSKDMGSLRTVRTPTDTSVLTPKKITGEKHITVAECIYINSRFDTYNKAVHRHPSSAFMRST